PESLDIEDDTFEEPVKPNRLAEFVDARGLQGWPTVRAGLLVVVIGMLAGIGAIAILLFLAIPLQMEMESAKKAGMPAFQNPLNEALPAILGLLGACGVAALLVF